MRVFIVDDDPANVRLLESLLTLEGHDCYSAANGREAIEKISAIDPDIVLLDVQMPELDGYETAEHIKSRIHNGRFIPILFLTALTDDAALARCLECGGDDFLSKPYSRVILRSKIRALERVHKLNRQINSQAAELRTQRAQLEKDLDIARGVMAKIARADKIDSSCLSYRVESIERFCGDLVIANRTPTGGLMAFLGDFTGHGLPAAVCALPVTSTFYTMSAKGFSIGEIAVEINEKLKRMLTTGLFCAGCLIEIDATRSTLTIWNGGLPDVLVLDQHGRVRHRARSQHLALGVVEAKRDYRRVDRVEIEAGMQVVAISDGVTEARRTGHQGIIGGQEFEDSLDANCRGRDLVDGVFDWLGSIGNSPTDDASVMVIDLDRPLDSEDSKACDGTDLAVIASEWRVSWDFGASTLRALDPLPLIMEAWNQFPAPRSHRETLYTVIAELYSNALDHGVLGLESNLKESPEGFGYYYEERERRLSELEEGQISVELAHRPTEHGGIVTIVVEDSGSGFGAEESGRSLEGNLARFGRGMALVRSVCEDVAYNEVGNRVEATYSWCLAPA